MNNSRKGGNKLIAEFMGLLVDGKQCLVYPHWLEMEYYSSWDWLMPVVEKIEKLHDGVFSFFIVQTECDIALSSPCKENGDDWYAPNFAQKKGDKLISTWSAVVEFIKWYNKI